MRLRCKKVTSRTCQIKYNFDEKIPFHNLIASLAAHDDQYVILRLNKIYRVAHGSYGRKSWNKYSCKNMDVKGLVSIAK